MADVLITDSSVIDAIDGELVTLNNARYAPLADVLVIPAASMVARLGSPAYSNINSIPVWLIASGEDVGMISPPMPAHWTTFNVTLKWMNAGAGTGDVEWNCRGGNLPADGVATAAPASYGAPGVGTTTAGALGVPVATVLALGAAVGATRRVVLQPRRNASTLANDVGLYEVILSRAS